MAQPGNTQDAYDAIGLREDLADGIYTVNIEETPFLSSIRAGDSSSNYKHEWLKYALRAPAQNRHIDGDTSAGTAPQNPTRLDNMCQIHKDTPTVSGRARNMDTAGRADELDWQMHQAKLGQKKDIELALVGLNNAKVEGNSTTPGELASYQTYVTSGTSAGTGGSDATGDGSDARTDGTQRVLNETIFNSAMQAIFDAGGNPKIVMAGSFNKLTIDGFTGGATKYERTDDRRLTSTVDIIAGAFGTYDVQTNRIQRSRDVLAYDPEFWAWSTVPGRNMMEEELAKDGDYDKRHVITDGTLEARNEASSGLIADLTVS